MARDYYEPATFNEKAKYVSKEKCRKSGIGSASMTSTARYRMEAKLAQLCLDCVCKEEELKLELSCRARTKKFKAPT